MNGTKIETPIKTPVRYDEKSNHIFDADGNSVAWFSRNTHHPEYDKKTEAGEWMATAMEEAGK